MIYRLGTGVPPTINCYNLQFLLETWLGQLIYAIPNPHLKSFIMFVYITIFYFVHMQTMWSVVATNVQTLTEFFNNLNT